MNEILYDIKKKILGRIYSMGEWHESNWFDRPYCVSVIKEISNYMQSHYSGTNRRSFTIVGIGCGCGEIVGNIRAPKNIKMIRYGYDINNNNLKVAKWMYPKVIFREGTFGDVRFMNVDCLILINFIHNINPDMLKKQIYNIILNCDVGLIVMDNLVNVEGTEYMYSHDGNYLFDNRYKMIKKSRGFKASSGARRYITYWKRGA